MNRIPVVAVSIGMATGIYAISFGALGVTAGLTTLETMLLSLVMFSGASQFAFVGVVATGGMAAIPTAIASAWLLGVRNGFYALRMAPVLGMPGIAKMLSAPIDNRRVHSCRNSSVESCRRAARLLVDRSKRICFLEFDDSRRSTSW